MRILMRLCKSITLDMLSSHYLGIAHSKRIAFFKTYELNQLCILSAKMIWYVSGNTQCPIICCSSFQFTKSFLRY